MGYIINDTWIYRFSAREESIEILWFVQDREVLFPWIACDLQQFDYLTFNFQAICKSYGSHDSHAFDSLSRKNDSHIVNLRFTFLVMWLAHLRFIWIAHIGIHAIHMNRMIWDSLVKLRIVRVCESCESFPKLWIIRLIWLAWPTEMRLMILTCDSYVSLRVTIIVARCEFRIAVSDMNRRSLVQYKEKK